VQPANAEAVGSKVASKKAIARIFVIIASLLKRGHDTRLGGVGYSQLRGLGVSNSTARLMSAAVSFCKLDRSIVNAGKAAL
jgi:hypothetical protein